jgi:hypothetical protein
MSVDDMGPSLRSSAEMPKQLQQRTALLLIAILAMLPLHGIQAALNSLSHQHGDGHPPAQHVEHVMMDSAGMHVCQLHQPESADSASDHHQCNGYGCDMCGACYADMPSHTVLLLSHEPMLLEPGDDGQQPRSQAYPLFRPPRA